MEASLAFKADKLTVLMIDDDQAISEVVKDALSQRFPDAIFVYHQQFDAAVMEQVKPGIVILDLYEGNTASGKNAGAPLWKLIMSKHFIPVVIFTGGEATLDPPLPEKHPFVELVSKGSGKETAVMDVIARFLPRASDLKALYAELDAIIHTTLAESPEETWTAMSDDVARARVLVRGVRRRIAARMDLSALADGETLCAWEQFVIPPIESQLLCADLIRKADGSATDAASYRLVLTPSCDLVPRGGKAKVSDVLVAPCVKMDECLRTIEITKERVSKERSACEKELRSRLTQPHIAGYVPLPAHPAHLPHMAATLRKLELIPLSDIAAVGETGKRFIRVASIDSPFREQIAFAYGQFATRFGMPDRDISAWAKELLQ